MSTERVHQPFESTPSSSESHGIAPTISVVRANRREQDWVRRYASRLVFSDLAAIVLTLVVYSIVALDDLRYPVAWAESGPVIPYVVVLAALGITWFAALAVLDTRDRHVVGNGILEYRRIVNATLAVFAVLISIAFFLQADIARSLFAIALPAGLVLLLITRWGWRQWLRARQRNGEYTYRAVVVGEPLKVQHIIEQILRNHGTGYEIVGAVSGTSHLTTVAGVPMIGSIDSIAAAVDRVNADTVIFAGADTVEPKQLRALGWQLADRDVSMVVAPALTDVAGPRIHATPAAGLPLIHVDFPSLEGYKRFLKRSFDLVGGSIIFLVLSPIMLATIISIKIDGPGPIFYSQERVGRRGRSFGMIKFRSMVANADDQLASLLDLQGTSDQPLFKVVDDPRITKVGRFIRKHSIDELPQILNVLRGEMSLVGPRPQRPAEVALYDDAAHRRLLVKPGMSGLWQVSGRSALSWDDAIRLDLYYVENWSFTQDLQILFRTVRAVLAPGETAH